MARLFSFSDINKVPDSEKKLIGAAKKLSDKWTIFHSVLWQSLRHGREGDGEADFVFLHADYGLIVVEVKGGEIVLENGKWYSINRLKEKNQINDPYKQVVASKYALLNFIREVSNDKFFVPIQHAVCFPDTQKIPQLGPAAPPEITWGLEGVFKLEDCLLKTIKHWGMNASLKDNQIKLIVDALAPTTKITKRLSDQIAENEFQILELTDEQRRTFSLLKKARRAVVNGSAGTGKTVLAVEKARQLADGGLKTLYVCFNELLANKLQSELKDVRNLTVGTFHSFCLSEAKKAKIPFRIEKSDQWWQVTAPKLLREAATKSKPSFGAVIVDEGQDFDAEWIDSLTATSTNTSDTIFFVFLDNNQNIYKRLWQPPNDWFQCDLTLNCRNSKPIAQRVAKIFNMDVLTKNIEGPTPIFIALNDWHKAEVAIQNQVEMLLKEGVAADKIKVLSDDLNLITDLRENTVREHSFTNASGRGIGVESIARFKGLESEVVVVAISPRALLDKNELKKISYVAFSRARSMLVVIANDDGKALEWQSN